MEPQASAQLVELLIEISVRDFGAKNGDDFPEIILDSIPISDFISNPTNVKLALNILRRRIDILKVLNISSFAIACNTAHIMFDELQAKDSRFVSMIDEVVKRVSEKKLTKVGLLASPSTLRFGLFEHPLDELNIEIILPTKREQETIEMIIRNIISGKKLQSDKEKLTLIANTLKSRGAQGVILGCTELPLIFPKKFSLPIFNCLEILASALLRKFHGGNTIRA